MPELPEVHTTSSILDELISNKTIIDLWSDYRSVFHEGKSNIKDKVYFEQFKKEVLGKKILGVRRRGKNVLIDLSGETTILVHMKMTGHLLYGKYKRNKQVSAPPSWQSETWIPDAEARSPLFDPFNRFIHLVLSLSDDDHLVLSDVRKFAKVIYFKTNEERAIADLNDLGPEPFDLNFDPFKARLNIRPQGKIKQVLMDQKILAGIGNIYSDEILWTAAVHPLSTVSHISEKCLRGIFTAMQIILKKGIDFSGDSTSDYRMPNGERGAFQHHHSVYQNTGTRCKRHGCKGVIERIKIGGRSGHFCPVHQQKFQ